MLVQELKDLPAKKVRVVFEDAEDLVLYRGEKIPDRRGRGSAGRRVP